MDLLALVQVVDPAAIERARRLQFAIQMITQGHKRRVVSGMVSRRYGLAQNTSWLLVDMAVDLADPLQQPKAKK